MKKIIIASILMISGIIQAQNFQGMAVYESKTSTAEFAKGLSGNKDITPEMQKQIEERMKKMFEKTFILNFDKSASIYKEEEKLDAPGEQGGRRMMASMMGGGGTHYKNVKDKQFIVDREFFGKEFLIKDSLPKYDWKMEGESKQIGNYTCFKATAVVKVNESDFRNFRFRNRDKKETETKTETVKDTTKAKKTNFTEDWEMPKENTITAWYCPEIPVNQGPENYWGLPGLILEVNDGKTVMLCTKIVMNTKDRVEIKPVTKGKEVTQTEYNDIVKKKMEEMQEMNSGPGGQQRGGFRMSR
ncbi:GLPGLI family protein [Flavobacterium sp. HXWNR29]|uniref:GLPGLI family protein n=1 Tax=Flavobacterium odoriferum TaxID=2946604 RepID=UPI0021CB8D89|nr:GLPGLI family protein [Flavobacterium sp. HXWNR29]MCU4189051.1 GLPGLI family protein [Flavobacterium sp. HXWNR29]